MKEVREEVSASWQAVLLTLHWRSLGAIFSVRLIAISRHKEGALDISALLTTSVSRIVSDINAALSSSAAPVLVTIVIVGISLCIKQRKLILN